MKRIALLMLALVVSACADPNTCPERARQDTIGVALVGLPLGSMNDVPCFKGDAQ